MWNLIAILALAVAAPDQVSATKLDGTSATGRLVSWSDNEIVLAVGTKKERLPTADLLSLELSAQPSDDTGEPLVELVDGSALPLSNYGTSGETAHVWLCKPADAAAAPITVPVQKVKAVRLQAISPDVLAQWQEIRGLGLPSDLLVIAKRGGKSLDHLECVLGEVTDSEVAFVLDGEKMRVPRSKVAGIIYFRADDVDAAPAPFALVGPGGLRLMAAEIRWQEDGTLKADTLASVSIVWPISQVSSIDMSAGKVQFLSDLKPVTASWQPLIDLPTEASRAAKFGQVRFNRSASGGPLTLLFPNADPAPGANRFKAYNKGLAVRSRTELVYRLPTGYQRFLAEAGIEPATAASGNVVLNIYGDDRQLFEHPIDGGDAPVPIDLPVVGVKRLEIVVDYGENLDTGDWLNLCNARVVK